MQHYSAGRLALASARWDGISQATVLGTVVTHACLQYEQNKMLCSCAHDAGTCSVQKVFDRSNNRVIRVFLWSAPDLIKHISQRVDRSPPKRRWLNFCYHAFTAVMVSPWNPDCHTHQVFTMSHNGGRHVLFFSAVVVVTIREHVVKVTDGKTLRNWRRAFPLHLMNPLHVKLYLPFSRDSSSAPGRVFINGAERGMNTRITVSVCSYLHPGPGGSLWNHI